MELSSLKGNIIGVISNDYANADYSNKLVSEIVTKKPEAALKMVGLSENVLTYNFSDLSLGNKNKIILASKLNDSVITIINFSQGLTKKEMEFFKRLFKKITGYNRKIILVDKNSELFLNCVDNLYVINKNSIVYNTNDLYDEKLEEYMDLPKIVQFKIASNNKGISINHYSELDELLKAIYRIKS